MPRVKKKGLRIAIDGPAAAGKSTVAAKVAKALGYTYVDTGAMYRALAVTALRKGIDLKDAVALGEMARHVSIEAFDDDGIFRVIVDGVDMTGDIRDSAVDKAVKDLAMAKPVREVLVGIQRAMGLKGSVVMEGRDIQSLVLKDAEIKIFLTASLEERAKRRFLQLSSGGIKVYSEEVLKDMDERDRKDLEREWGRLVKSEDAVVIDSTRMSVCEVVGEIVGICEAKVRCSTGYSGRFLGL